MEQSNQPASLNVHSSPAVNQELLRKAAEINQQLEKFGLAPSLDYKLAPALGGTLVGKPPVHGMTTQSSFGNPAATGPAPA